jgi:hypothetical protein
MCPIRPTRLGEKPRALVEVAHRPRKTVPGARGPSHGRDGLRRAGPLVAHRGARPELGGGEERSDLDGQQAQSQETGENRGLDEHAVRETAVAVTGADRQPWRGRRGSSADGAH